MIPPFTRPTASLADALTDYLNEHAGPGWRASGGHAAYRAYDGIGAVSVSDAGASVWIGGWNGMVSARLSADISVAATILRDPDALRDYVRGMLAAALTSIDSEPTP